MIPSQTAEDRATIATVARAAGDPEAIVYDHHEPQADPLLWAADGYAWAVLAGKAPTATVIDIP